MRYVIVAAGTPADLCLALMADTQRWHSTLVVSAGTQAGALNQEHETVPIDFDAILDGTVPMEKPNDDAVPVFLIEACSMQDELSLKYDELIECRSDELSEQGTVGVEGTNNPFFWLEGKRCRKNESKFYCRSPPDLLFTASAESAQKKITYSLKISLPTPFSPQGN